MHRKSSNKGIEEMKESDRYLKIAEWSQEDNCYVGTCPGLISGVVHGDNEADVCLESG